MNVDAAGRLTLHVGDIAHICHEANRALQSALGEDPNEHWHAAPEWMRASAIHGVLAADGGASPDELHESWSAEKVAAGWTYGPVKDADAKTHPCLVPYAELPAEQRAKDALFHAICGVFAAAAPGVTASPN